ncbi:MAG: 2-C-methyl-D-erythritol 2,4-cyclodiphosphate synthase [Planctomycetota bacterium]
MATRAIDRIGIGTDIHRLEPGGRLRLCGIEVEHEMHLHGHSDGDVVLHAVADALLGAAGLPDIGEHYPDTDPRNAGLDSRKLLAGVVEKVLAAGFTVASLDLVIHAERPKLSDHKEAMRECLANLLALPQSRVGIKAKTNEGLDAIGRGEAIACTCVAGLASLADSNYY